MHKESLRLATDEYNYPKLDQLDITEYLIRTTENSSPPLAYAAFPKYFTFSNLTITNAIKHIEFVSFNDPMKRERGTVIYAKHHAIEKNPIFMTGDRRTVQLVPTLLEIKYACYALLFNNYPRRMIDIHSHALYDVPFFSQDLYPLLMNDAPGGSHPPEASIVLCESMRLAVFRSVETPRLPRSVLNIYMQRQNRKSIQNLQKAGVYNALVNQTLQPADLQKAVRVYITDLLEFCFKNRMPVYSSRGQSDSCTFHISS